MNADHRSFECISRNIASALLVMLLQPVPALAQGQAYAIDIPSQDLGTALGTLARATQQQIAFESSSVKGTQSAALKGRYSIQEALDALLLGSGFHVEHGQSGLWIIRADAAVEKSEMVGEPLDRVVVTGSRIARSSKSIPGSFTLFDKESIERSGESSVRDIVAQSSQAGMTPSAASAFLGAAPVQLRGLSTGTTLVLIDGRRVTPSGVTGVSFDLGSIPLSAVERIEVLADGASAIYGADAVGGIINVILKRSGKGLTLDGRYGVAEGGVGQERRLSANYGFSSGGLRGSLTADYFKTDGIRFGERDRTSDLDYRRFGFTDRRQPYTSQGTVYSRDGSNLPGLTSSRAIIPTTASGKPSISDFVATAGQESRGSEYYQQTYLQPPVERFGAVADLTYDLGGGLMAFANVLASRQNGEYLSTLPFVSTTVIVPKGNPYNPFGVDVGVNKLLLGVGADLNKPSDTFTRVLGGMRGKLGNGLRWELAANYSRDDNRVHEENYYDTARIQAALNNPDPAATLNLFTTGPVASAAVLQSLLPAIDKRYRASAFSTDAQLSGSILDLPGGPLSFAVGAEARREKLDIASPFDNTRGSRNVASGYFELRAPVLEKLALSGAGRYDHYSDFGSTFNPKIGYEWAPVEGLLFSGTWGSSFRAPPLSYINSVPFTIPVSATDPTRGGAVVTVPATVGGGANLKAEKADSYTLGARFTPIDADNRHLDVGLSAWWVKQDDRAVSANYQILVDHPDLFPNRVIRAPQTAEDIALGRPGALQSIHAGYLNFGKSRTNGIDVQLNYRDKSGPVRWSLSGNVTRVLKYEAELAPGAIEDRLGAFSFDGFAPRWRGSLAGSIGYGAFELSPTIRYVGSYQDRRGAPYTLASTTFVDLQLAYQDKAATGFLKGVRAAIGVSNLLNKEPPFFNASFGYDPYNFNNRGRFIYVNLQKHF